VNKRHLIYPLFLPMRGCPRRCVYCDQNKISGSGEFDLENAVGEVAGFIRRNPGRDKQVAFYGGSFTALDEAFRSEVIERIGSVCDPKTTFRISTHPLYVESAILDWCASKGIRTIELGIQDFCDAVLVRSGRGYTGQEAREAALRVKERGFELGAQLMPGLPGWSDESLRINHDALAELKPALLRLYPLIVIKGTPLERIYLEGKYKPLSLEEAVDQCADYFPLAKANGIRIIKLGLPANLSPEAIVAGPWHPAFGELVRAELRYRLMFDPASDTATQELSERDLALIRVYRGAEFNPQQRDL